jgi:nucleoside-diphosphate-sugar epimerase
VKIAVTGAKGYAGSHIAAALRAQGHEVIELVRNPSPGAESGSIRCVLGEPVDAEAFRSHGIESLVHVAYDFKQTEWDDIRRVNYEGSVALFDAFLSAGGKHGVYISTVAAWPGCKSMYGKAKLLTEQAAVDRGFWVVRPGLIRGGSPGGIVGTMLKFVKKLPAVPIIGYGKKCLYPIGSDELSAIVAKLAVRDPADSADALVVAAHKDALSLDDVVREMTAEQGLKRRFLIPVPWRPMWLLLKTLEKLDMRIGLRSDSVVSLMNQDPSPPFRDLSKL